MSKLNVRPASEEDREELEQLIADCYAEVYPNWYGEDVVDSAMRHMLRIDPALLQSGRYLAAEKDGKLVACGGWSPANPGSGDTEAGLGHMRHFATHPDYMRQGIGSAVLKASLDAAKAEGIQKVQCFSSLPGEEFYGLHGFRSVSEVMVQLGDGGAFPAILMERDLV